jgi:hypothetical protein
LSPAEHHCNALKLTADMKVYYIGVRCLLTTITILAFWRASQILRNDPSPATELAVEKDLSAFSRFTRDRFAPFNSSKSDLQPGW